MYGLLWDNPNSTVSQSAERAHRGVTLIYQGGLKMRGREAADCVHTPLYAKPFIYTEPCTGNPSLRSSLDRFATQ
jgi:hypothetical protein